LPATTAPGAAARMLYDPAALRARREAAGLTREQVHLTAPVGRSWLAELEQGTPRRQPSLGLIFRLAELYGCPPGELLASTGGNGC
jgi:transcriptional regulator with XRE-family HTH domain